jgi:hypothetical protein
MTDFAGLIRTLADGEIEFILVGGVAATVHGSTRLTRDIDIVYARTEENIGRLVRALAPLRPYLRGAPPGLPFVWDDGTLNRGLNFTLTTSFGAIDLLGEIAGGGGFYELEPHSFLVEIFDREVRCLNLEWLIRTKRAAGRPRDLEVIAELECIRDEMGSDEEAR